MCVCVKQQHVDVYELMLKSHLPQAVGPMVLSNGSASAIIQVLFTGV